LVTTKRLDRAIGCFFTAGISDEAHGLFGFFVPADNSAPEANGDDR